MFSLLLALIYVSFISLGLPDGLLGSAWPSMYPGLGVPVSGAGALSMIICVGTILSSLSTDHLNRGLGTGKITGYDVTVQLEADEQLKLGMNGTVTIAVGQQENALLVPLTATEAILPSSTTMGTASSSALARR